MIRLLSLRRLKFAGVLFVFLLLLLTITACGLNQLRTVNTNEREGMNTLPLTEPLKKPPIDEMAPERYQTATFALG